MPRTTVTCSLDYSHCWCSFFDHDWWTSWPLIWEIFLRSTSRCQKWLIHIRMPVGDPGISEPTKGREGGYNSWSLGMFVWCLTCSNFFREWNKYCKHCMWASMKVYACYWGKIFKNKHKKIFQKGFGWRVDLGSAFSSFHLHILRYACIDIVSLWRGDRWNWTQPWFGK